MKMDEIEYRAVIKYLFSKSNTPTQIKNELDSVYGNSAPSFTTMKFWTAEFKRARKSDFFLFPQLKIALGGQRFSSNEEAITFVNNYFAEKNAEYYLDGLQRWEHRWEKCVEIQEDYAKE